jgi:hypothetical protein
MKPTMLFLSLLSACELEAARDYRTYKLTWSCQTSDGCERAEQVALINRATITDGDDEFIIFTSNRVMYYETAQRIPSNELPSDCAWLYGMDLFAHELEPGRFCSTSGGFTLEIAIPNRDPTTHSAWLVEAHETDG